MAGTAAPDHSGEEGWQITADLPPAEGPVCFKTKAARGTAAADAVS